MNRRDLLKCSAGAALGLPLAHGAASNPRNFIVILCDDMGYGDIRSYGSSIATPNLDRMGREGMRFTNAITANPVCSPSRAALLTGRYPTRVGVPRVIMQPDKSGLAKDETTLAELLKKKDYATACIGKWHLGHQPDQLPTRRGFDSYYGVPYSNDMKPAIVYENETVVEQEAEQDTLTRRYTDRAVQFIEKNAARPFFLYLPHTFPHIPLHASEAFRGKSPLGIYGDVVNELDWSTGRILDTLKKRGLDSNTLVVFTSDNGPWHQGSQGGTRGRKGAAWEGGVRVPFLAWQPGSIPAGRTSKTLVSLLDIFPTIAGRCGLTAPKPVDGADIWPLLSGSQAAVKRSEILYFMDRYLQCIRRDDWKLHLARFNGWVYTPGIFARLKNLPLPTPELYNLALDPDEGYDVAAGHPDIVQDLTARAEALIAEFPEYVRAAWTQTRQIKVQPTPAGAYPVEES
jgi:arylsulfatase